MAIKPIALAARGLDALEAKIAEADRKADLALAQAKALTAGLRLLDEACGSPFSDARGEFNALLVDLEKEDPDE